MNNKTENTFSFHAKAGLLVGLLATLGMTGCAGTLDTRWAKGRDSTDAWSARMATLPIDVHGQLPGQDAQQSIASIPGGTTAALYAQTHLQAPVLDTHKRIELYLGQGQLSGGDSYCAARPMLSEAEPARHGVLLTAALCDGSRLVETDRLDVKDYDLDQTRVADTIAGLKTKLLFGLETSVAQQPTQYEY